MKSMGLYLVFFLNRQKSLTRTKLILWKFSLTLRSLCDQYRRKGVRMGFEWGFEWDIRAIMQFVI